MGFKVFRCAVASVVLGSALGISTIGVQAKSQFTTSHKYYKVSGSSAATILNNSHVPSGFFGSTNYHAVISIKPKFDGSMKAGKKYCRFDRLKLGAHFTIRLPKLVRGAGGGKNLQRKFASFALFAKRHEHTHRSIWISCFKRSERKIHSLRIRSCRQLDIKAAKIIEREIAVCDRRHARFDRSERKKLNRQPLVRAAVKQVKTSRRKKTYSSPRRRTALRAGPYSN